MHQHSGPLIFLWKVPDGMGTSSQSLAIQCRDAACVLFLTPLFVKLQFNRYTDRIVQILPVPARLCLPNPEGVLDCLKLFAVIVYSPRARLEAQLVQALVCNAQRCQQPPIPLQLKRPLPFGLCDRQLLPGRV